MKNRTVGKTAMEIAILLKSIALTLIAGLAIAGPVQAQSINWLDKDELMMSDIPWAIAWYGDRQCVWLTKNTTAEFFGINDFIKPVNGLFLTLNTLDARLFTDCLHGGNGSWSSFVYQSAVANKIPADFPLRQSPAGLSSGLFLTDKQRWKTQ